MNRPCACVALFASGIFLMGFGLGCAYSSYMYSLANADMARLAYHDPNEEHNEECDE